MSYMRRFDTRYVALDNSYKTLTNNTNEVYSITNKGNDKNTITF